MDSIRGVWANLGTGDIVVATEQRDTVAVSWEGGGAGKAASPDVVETSDGWLEVNAGGLLGGGQISATLPIGTALEAFVDRGDIDIRLAGPSNITACVGAGSVTIHVPPGRWNLQLDGAAGVVDSDVVHDPESDWRIGACVGAGDIHVTTVHP